jgi:hypothetical protein
MYRVTSIKKANARQEIRAKTSVNSVLTATHPEHVCVRIVMRPPAAKNAALGKSAAWSFADSPGGDQITSVE